MSTTTQNIEPKTDDTVADTDLPEGWNLASIGEVLTVNYGKGLKEADRVPGETPVFGSNGVVGRHRAALTGGPTVIIGRKGTIGAIHFSPRPCWPIDTTYFIDDFRELDPIYVTHALRTLNLGEHDTSTAIPGLNRDDIYAQEIPLAPQAEQKRIVAKIQELLNQVNAARARLAKLPIILKRFRQSVLAAACSGRLTEGWRKHQCEDVWKPQAHSLYDFQEAERPDLPEAWRSTDVEAICSQIVDCPHSTPKWTEHGAICLRTTNFQAGSLDLSEVRYVSESTYKERTSRLEPLEGDVLYSREAGILGLSCIVPPGKRLCLGQRMMLMRTKRESYYPSCLMHVLNSPDTNARVRDLTGGSASPHLNVATIKGFPVPVPPLKEQNEIVRRVEALFKLADTIEKRVAVATKRTDKLTQAILAKAFRGELVPTEAELARREGRDYEPASILLARISAERTAEPPGVTVRKHTGFGPKKQRSKSGHVT